MATAQTSGDTVSSSVLSPTSLDDAGKLLLRLTVGGLMLFHGVDKVLRGVEDIQDTMARNGFPELMAYGVYLGEIVAPLLIIVGLWTRPAALLYAGTIIFATGLVHAVDYVSLAHTGGYGAELHVFYIVGGITVALLGAGRYSVGGRGTWD
jgi:putative oxidoreductase